MMGDVPVGVFLSGGLDSSLVAAIAARWAAREGTILHTFAVGTDGSPDLLAARTVAEFLGTDHHEIDYRAAEALESLPNVVRAIESFDPGLVRSAVPNYMLARMTRQHVRVVLTGEGADELFAGYDYLREFTEPDALRVELERTVRSLHNLNLQRCDRVTMAHAVEARVPFLDREVIEWALRVPADAKLAGPGVPEKRLLREAFDGWLPDELLWREKAEFGDGSGARDVLSEAIEGDISDDEFEAERGAVDAAAAHQGGARLLPRLARAPRRHQPRAHAQPLRPRVAGLTPGSRTGRRARPASDRRSGSVRSVPAQRSTRSVCVATVRTRTVAVEPERPSSASSGNSIRSSEPSWRSNSARLSP